MSVDAWLLALDEGLQAAVGRLELLHLLEYPDCYPLPGSPPHCAVALLWEGEVLPVVDLGAWLRDREMDPLPTLAAVVQYRMDAASVARGALVLHGPPTLIQVTDRMACELPDSPAGWRRLAISCFRWADRAIPVVDLARLYRGDLPSASDG